MKKIEHFITDCNIKNQQLTIRNYKSNVWRIWTYWNFWESTQIIRQEQEQPNIKHLI